MSSAETGNKVLEPCSRFFLYLWAFSGVVAVTDSSRFQQKSQHFGISCNQNATKIQNIFAKCLFSFVCSFFSTSVRVDL